MRSGHYAREDIVLLSYKAIALKFEAIDESPHLEAVLGANHGKPVMLINATFQLELTHHLDTPQEWQGC
jgi:hypothetical protein